MWWLVLILVGLACCLHSQELCSKPLTKKGCSAIKNVDECTSFPGCAWSSAKCADSPTCDALTCKLRELGFQSFSPLLPGCSPQHGSNEACLEQKERVYHGLGLEENCGQNMPEHTNIVPTSSINSEAAAEGIVLYVSPITGRDTNSGTSPKTALLTVHFAVQKLRAMRTTNTKKKIWLMSGTHRFTQTLELTSEDSNLIIEGVDGAVISAGVGLSHIPWRRMSAYNKIYEGDLSSFTNKQVFDELSRLYVNSNAAIRARAPNVNSYLDHVRFNGAKFVESWTWPLSKPATTTVRVTIAPGAETTRYKLFNIGRGGACEGMFTPAAGYWCDPLADGDGLCPLSWPNGVYLENQIGDFLNMTIAHNKPNVYFHTLHPQKWGGWTFKVDNGFQRTSEPTTTAQSSSPTPKPATTTTPYPTSKISKGSGGQLASRFYLPFASGGFQEARGDCGLGGGNYYLENSLQLLDYWNEFFLDLHAGKIYYLPSKGKNFDATAMELGGNVSRLIQAVGTADEPVRNLVFTNLKFEKTYPTHMHAHEMTSGGDVALHRGGALFLEGVENVTVQRCKFYNLGSSGVFVSRYARQVTIVANDFYKLESNAIFLVGDAKLDSKEPWDRTKDLDYVQDVSIKRNLASDMGIVEIQACAVLISIARNIVVEDNVFFNGPRGGIVLNDQFGGNITLKHNFLFGFVLETLDHGPYNVWDRQRWLLPDGFVLPVYVENNFIIGTASGEKLLDADDGANLQVMRNNVLIDGHIKFKGSDLKSYGNVIIVGRLWACLLMLTAHTTPANWEWHHNTCFARQQLPPYAWRNNLPELCKKPGFDTHDNAYFGAKIDYTSGYFKCAKTRLSQWTVGMAQDVRTSWNPMPSIQYVVDACQAKMNEW